MEEIKKCGIQIIYSHLSARCHQKQSAIQIHMCRVVDTYQILLVHAVDMWSHDGEILDTLRRRSIGNVDCNLVVVHPTGSSIK